MQRKFRDVIDSEKSENVQEYRLKTWTDGWFDN
jgi:hypothetical protein